MKFLSLLILTVLTLVPLSVSAENLVHTELSVFNLLTYAEGTDPTYSMGGAVDLSFDSGGYRNMKGGISLVFADTSGNATDMSLVTVKQLEIKSRFPSIRLTTGLTRLDWGEGTLLNSGNSLFSEDAETVRFDESSLDLQRKWLLSLQKPLSPFSFLEGALIAPPDDDGDVETPVPMDHITGGFRYYNGEKAIAWETGLAVTREGGDPLLTPHIALSGGALVEWYAALSTSFSFDGEAGTTAQEKFNGSAGVYQIFSFDSGASLTARLEGRLFPFSEQEDRLLLYPSVVYALSNSAQFSLQAVIAALDMSAAMSAGASWNVFEGFTMSAFCTTSLGESGDTYTYDALTATLAFSTIF
ncbi:MAG: hypothetical protein JXK93_00630 [Sphaerochaetaceae bacterium]|nr:hypothetical protein [Sphaerochaetaceae bacterium]